MKIANPDNGVEAIWALLATGNRYYRAAAILLLQEYTKTLVANGRGEYASQLVQEFRDADPQRGLRSSANRNKLVP